MAVRTASVVRRARAGQTARQARRELRVTPGPRGPQGTETRVRARERRGLLWKGTG